MDGESRQKRIDYREYDQFNLKVDGKKYLVWITERIKPNEWCPCLVGPVYLDSWCPFSDDTVDGEENVYFISRKIEKSYRVYFLQFEILKRTRFKNSKKPWLDSLQYEINLVHKLVHKDELYDYLVYRRQYFSDILSLLSEKDHYLGEEALEMMFLLEDKIRNITR